MSNGMKTQAGANGQHTLKVRTALQAGGLTPNHNETLKVRSALKAGKLSANHNDAMRVRTGLNGGGQSLNHNENIRHDAVRNVFMRRDLRTIGAGEDRLELMVVRTGLRAGARRSLRKRQ